MLKCERNIRIKCTSNSDLLGPDWRQYIVLFHEGNSLIQQIEMTLYSQADGHYEAGQPIATADSAVTLG